MTEFDTIQLQVAMAGLSADEMSDHSSVEEWTATLDQVTYRENGSTSAPTRVAEMGFVRVHDLVFEHLLVDRLDAHSAELLYVGEQLIGPTGEIDDDLRQLRTSLIVITSTDTTNPARFTQLVHGVARIFNDSMIGIVPEDHATPTHAIGVDEIRLRTITKNCLAAGFTPYRGGLMLLPHPERLTN